MEKKKQTSEIKVDKVTAEDAPNFDYQRFMKMNTEDLDGMQAELHRMRRGLRADSADMDKTASELSLAENLASDSIIEYNFHPAFLAKTNNDSEKEVEKEKESEAGGGAREAKQAVCVPVGNEYGIKCEKRHLLAKVPEGKGDPAACGNCKLVSPMYYKCEQCKPNYILCGKCFLGLAKRLDKIAEYGGGLLPTKDNPHNLKCENRHLLARGRTEDPATCSNCRLVSDMYYNCGKCTPDFVLCGRCYNGLKDKLDEVKNQKQRDNVELKEREKKRENSSKAKVIEGIEQGWNSVKKPTPVYKEKSASSEVLYKLVSAEEIYITGVSLPWITVQSPTKGFIMCEDTGLVNVVKQFHEHNTGSKKRAFGIGRDSHMSMTNLLEGLGPETRTETPIPVEFGWFEGIPEGLEVLSKPSEKAGSVYTLVRGEEIHVIKRFHDYAEVDSPVHGYVPLFMNGKFTLRVIRNFIRTQEKKYEWTPPKAAKKSGKGQSADGSDGRKFLYSAVDEGGKVNVYQLESGEIDTVSETITMKYDTLRSIVDKSRASANAALSPSGPVVANHKHIMQLLDVKKDKFALEAKELEIQKKILEDNPEFASLFLAKLYG